MPLKIDLGYSSLTGPRERNEDFCGVATPEGQELENKGVIAAVADGIGGHKGGREAAEYTVRGLLAFHPPAFSSRTSSAASSEMAMRARLASFAMSERSTAITGTPHKRSL